MRPRETPRRAVLGIIWILYGDELKSFACEMVSLSSERGFRTSTHLDKARSVLPFLRWPSFGQNQRDISQIVICKGSFLRIVVIFTCDGNVGEVELVSYIEKSG